MLRRVINRLSQTKDTKIKILDENTCPDSITGRHKLALEVDNEERSGVVD